MKPYHSIYGYDKMMFILCQSEGWMLQMIGVIANAAAVFFGGLLGLRLKGGIAKRFETIIQNALALCVLLIGLSGALKTDDLMLVILCLIGGSILGEWLRIEDGLTWLGERAQARFAKAGDNTFAQGFITTTLLFCVGAMGVVGALEAGLANNPDTLLAKSVLDGVSSIIFASTLGAGVMLSAAPLLIYQGGIALMAGVIAPLLPQAVIAEMSAVGSMMIVGLALNLLGVMKERIRVGNMLPAMFLPPLYLYIMSLIAR